MTNREKYEEVSGISLDNLFFKFNDINPDAEYIEDEDKNQISNAS